MKIKKYINLSLILLLAGLIYSCSGDNIINGESPLDPDTGGGDTKGEQTTLSMFFGQSDDLNTKSASNPDATAESQIYSLDILIFKSGGGADQGKIDTYIHKPRTIKSVPGQTEEYNVITEVRDIVLTIGRRDIYVIANAPDSPNGFFHGKTTLAQFKAEVEKLSDQRLIPHPGTIVPGGDDEDPIGGINPSDLKTNLTMMGYFDAQFTTAKHHYLGYTDPGGLPSHAISGGAALDPNTNPFYLERLAARVAVKKIKFDFSASSNLVFESGYPAVGPNDYTYQLDSVFMLNVKTGSRYHIPQSATDSKLTGNFGYGCLKGYNYLKTTVGMTNLTGIEADYLTEPIFSREYDIAVNSTPIWFYAFENDATENYPTYLVIGVRYNFKSSKDQKFKTAKYYYPVIVNKPGSGSSTHNYIKRNNQYFISATIRQLAPTVSTPVELKSAIDSDMYDNIIEVEEEVGTNLFPWTGNKYNK